MGKSTYLRREVAGAAMKRLRKAAKNKHVLVVGEKHAVRYKQGTHTKEEAKKIIFYSILKKTGQDQESLSPVFSHLSAWEIYCNEIYCNEIYCKIIRKKECKEKIKTKRKE